MRTSATDRHRCCSPRLWRGGAFWPTALAATLWHLTLWQSAAMAQEAGGGAVQSSSRGWIVDALIVAALFGLALFVICRSSHRN